MSIKKLSFMLLSALSLAALLNGCGSSSKEGAGTPGTVAKVPETLCNVCHAASTDPLSGRNIVQDFLASPHNTALAGCQGCHGGGAQHNGVGPIPFPKPTDRCNVCHDGSTVLGTIAVKFGTDAVQTHHTGTYFPAVGGTDKCGTCHNPHNPLGHFVGGSCVACHAFPQDRSDKGNYVNDNNGVRAITGEFAKWSHHVTGVTLNDAHCAACHLEGKAVDGKIVVDTNKHMRDAKVHLRNVDDDSEFAWDPATPNHSNMDNFCMSCHDNNGATSPMSAQIQAFINDKGLAAPGKTASASNPFGDTISNRYDKMQRPAVVDASSQFNTSNNSHHAVKGPRYSGNSRFSGVDANGNRRRQIANPVAFASNSSALLQGARSTIYDAGNFNQLYTPLENAGGEAAPRTGSKNLGDDSTLHCGDCHTVGQWKVGSSEVADGSKTPVAIGAHGSNNEYLLRNSIGTDQRHTQNAFVNVNGVVNYTNPNGAFLVCYNCHNYNKYGSIFLQTGVLGGHVGEYDVSGRCNSIGNTIPFNGYTTGTATDGTQFASRFTGPVSKFGATPAFAPGFPLRGNAPAGEVNPDFGNIFGIQCNNCHNSGVGNAYGGIHGSAKNTKWNDGTNDIQPDASVTGGAYIDGMGNTNKVERFLPGLGNVMHVPGNLGGFTGGVATTNGTTYSYITGGISNDTNWEQKHWQQTATTVINNVTGAVTAGTAAATGAGCYTLGATQVTGADILTKDVSSGLRGPSVTGAGGPATEVTDTWGACDDHTAGQGKGNHGFVKKIIRPITY